MTTYQLAPQLTSDDSDALTAELIATVRGLLAYRGIGVPDLAEVIGLSRSALYERLAGGSAFKASEVAAIAAAFRVPVGRLYDGLDAAS